MTPTIPEQVWRSIGKACVLLAMVSLLLNITTHWELEGHMQPYSFVRKSIAKVVSSGTAWAAIAFYAGWKIARPWTSFLAGIGAALATLFLHYTAGSLLAIYPANELTTNLIWFEAALVLCGPIGLAGCLARQRTRLCVLAQLVIPAGALLEPFAVGKFADHWHQRPWAERYSDLASGMILVGLGAASAAWVLWRATHQRRATVAA